MAACPALPVVTRQQRDDQAAQTLNRALRYVPAVTANPRIDPYF